LGLSLEEALAHVTPTLNESKVAGSAFCLALEMLQESPILTIETPSILPLLTPINALRENEIEAEIEKKLVQGFRTFKIKVGKDVKADLERVAAIQQIVGKRATLRVDANRAYTREEGVLFASSLNPHALELFEQPCDADDWEANAEVASVSNVPMMLDEPICSIEDISRAAEIKGVGFCKLKLKRFGTLRGLFEGLEYVRSCGMEPVLGDGLGSELTSWMEACVASKTIRNAGEFNGFLKPRERLFDNPLQFEKGNLILPRGYQPSLNLGRIGSFTCNTMTFDS
jgi:L-alanine-DL-glutamate epimerase-like enolase superfamily enzyme